jgi:signal transduction histidine kinase
VRHGAQPGNSGRHPTIDPANIRAHVDACARPADVERKSNDEMTAADRGSGGIVQRGAREARSPLLEASATSLGPLEHWPQSLRTAFCLCLSFRYPACLVWGTGRIQLFNDPYIELWSAGPAPRMGQDFAASWHADWPKLAASFDRAQSGECTVLDTPDGLLQSAGLRRHPAALSFVPVHAEGDTVGGVLVSVTGLQGSQPDCETADFELIDYVISHDLLAPARTMQEMARILGEERANDLPPDVGTFLGHFTRATASLTARIEGLVRFRKVSSQPLACRRVDIGTLARELVAGLQGGSPQAERTSVVIGDLPDSMGDRDLLRQAFSAVISNAFKFVRRAPAPRIEIGARREADRNVYFVADNGAGFEMKYASRLFGLFQRLHSDFEGTGVELAVAKRIVERHGGTMRAEGNKGVGATFELSLPPAADGAAA